MYEEPTRLPEPFDLPQPNVVPVYAFGLLAALVLGLALWALAQLAYVLVLYNLLLGLALGGLLALGARWGQYPLGVARTAFACSALAYLVFNVALYLGSIQGVAGSYPSFFEFIAYRAQQQTLLFGARPGPFLTPLVWLAEIALSGYVALRVAGRTTARIKLESVPTPVTEFVLYLLFQGHGTDAIASELAARGWTRPLDVVRALDAAEAAVELIRSPQSSQSSA